VDGRAGDPIALLDPMPPAMGAYVQTTRGTRRLMPEETGRGLGIPKEWKIDPDHITRGLLMRTTSLFHWEYILTTLLRADPCVMPSSVRLRSMTGGEMKDKSQVVEGQLFTWNPPDLREGQE
jgi:hypothetical protein